MRVERKTVTEKVKSHRKNDSHGKGWWKSESSLGRDDVRRYIDGGFKVNAGKVAREKKKKRKESNIDGEKVEM